MRRNAVEQEQDSCLYSQQQHDCLVSQSTMPIADTARSRDQPYPIQVLNLSLEADPLQIPS